jgi:hypothetical protein
MGGSASTRESSPSWATRAQGEDMLEDNFADMFAKKISSSPWGDKSLRQACSDIWSREQHWHAGEIISIRT